MCGLILLRHTGQHRRLRHEGVIFDLEAGDEDFLHSTPEHRKVEVAHADGGRDKNKLSEYVRLVANGETILVTDRDRVVAELPPRAGRSELIADAMLAEAMRRGWVTPPALVGAEAPPRKPVMTYRDLMEELHRDRDDR